MDSEEIKQRQYQKRYHFGKHTPCRNIRVPLEIISQIEALLTPWEREGYQPLNKDSLEQRRRPSIKDIVAKEVARVLNTPTMIESTQTVTEAAVIESTKPEEIKPTAKEVALQLHADGLNSKQITTELESRGYLSVIGKPIDYCVVSRWIKD